MTLSAHVEKNPNQAAMTYNKSSQIVHDTIVEEPVTEMDVYHIKQALKEFSGSFIETFAR